MGVLTSQSIFGQFPNSLDGVEVADPWPACFPQSGGRPTPLSTDCAAKEPNTILVGERATGWGTANELCLIGSAKDKDSSEGDTGHRQNGTFSPSISAKLGE